jgi:hypothetical protein
MCTPFRCGVEQHVKQEQNGNWGKVVGLCLQEQGIVTNV